MLKPEDITIYRKTCAELLWKLRACILSQNPWKRVSDKQVAELLDLSPTAFSLALSGASSLSGPVLYKVMIYLSFFGVEVFEFIKSHDLYYSAHLDNQLSFAFDIDNTLSAESRAPKVPDQGVDLSEHDRPAD